MPEDPRPTTIMLTTPGQIAHWVFLSRMFQLALELNTEIRHRGPILRAMYNDGILDEKLTNNDTNKRLVLQAMVDLKKKLQPGWEPSASIAAALEPRM